MQIERNIAKGQVIPLQFMQASVAANQTNAQLVLVDVATSPSLVDGMVLPFDGAVVGLSFFLDSAGSAGSLTIGASIDGTEVAATTQTVTTAASGYAAFKRDVAKFEAGAELGVEITTDGSWNGTSSDLAVILFVLIELEGV